MFSSVFQSKCWSEFHVTDLIKKYAFVHHWRKKFMTQYKAFPVLEIKFGGQFSNSDEYRNKSSLTKIYAFLLKSPTLEVPLWDAAHFQNGWIFGKVPNGLCHPLPHHFRKVILQISRQNCDKGAYVHMEGHLCIIWSYFQWDAWITNVQHGNRAKTYPKKTFLYHFHGQKALFKGPNFAI